MNSLEAQWTQANLPSAGDVRCFATILTGSGSMKLFAGTDSGGVYLSTDNGTNWAQANSGLTDIHVYALSTFPNASSGTNLFAGTSGGAFLSTDDGSSWNQSGLTNATVEAFAVFTSGAGDTDLFAGTDHGVYLSTNAGSAWEQVNNGLADTNIHCLASSGADLFAGTKSGLFLSTNVGESWAKKFSSSILTNSVNAIAVFPSAAGDTDIFIGCGYRSTDNGNTWTSFSSSFTALGISPDGAGDTLFVAGAYGGGVIYSTNYGTSWTQTSLTNVDVYSFAFSPNDTGGVNLFVGTGSKGVWKITLSGIAPLPINQVDFITNTIEAVLGNNGIYFYNRITGNDGLFWPAHSGKNAVCAAGPWLVGIGVNDHSLYSASCEYSTEYQPGPILSRYDGNPKNVLVDAADPRDKKWNVMVLSNSTLPSDSTYKAWVQNAAQTGAPLTPDGKPLIVGDQAAYWITNDLTSTGHNGLSSTSPLGVEVHNYVSAFDRSGALGQTLFMRLTFINKSSVSYDSCYFGWWSDIDLGDANDDLDGCDSARNLGYTYNGNPADAVYGNDPPADGYVLLEGPKVPTGNNADSAVVRGVWVHGCKNLPMTSYIEINLDDPRFADPRLGNQSWSQQAYDLLRGLIAGTGEPFTDNNGRPTKFVDYGDPVTGTGWLDDLPYDKRLLIGSGPFNFMPGDTQEVVVAYLIGQGTSNINSVEVLRKMADTVRAVFNSNFTVFTPVHTANNDVPRSFSLSQNFPNPFNPTTTISYELSANSYATLRVYDILGRVEVTLVNSTQTQGEHSVYFDGSKIASGVYLYRLDAVRSDGERFSATKKMVLMK